MVCDFYKAANELVSWAGSSPVGLVAVIFVTILAGAAAGCCFSRIKKWIDENCREPDRKPFKGIPTQKLPKSEFKV